MSAYEVTSSAELMENYLQADILRPQKKFTALQTDAGAALLFSIDSSNQLVVTEEVPGDQYGWKVCDLSKVLIGNEFPTGATCTEFAATQEAAKAGEGASIRLAMVIDDGQDDHLFVSLGNSDADTSWTDHPQWTACPFDARDAAGRSLPIPSPLKIVGVFISEATDGEFIAIDIARNPTSPVELVSRFRLDVSNPASPQWVPHDLPIDLEVDGYSSCLGRAAGGFGVDGIYTGGKIGGSAQLIYTPLWNVFDPKQPAPSSALKLPEEAVPEALATVRNPDSTTDLYVVAAGKLFYFAASNQRNGATGVLVVADPHFDGIRAFFASGGEGVTVWGLNGSDEVFYLAWPTGEPPQLEEDRAPAVILAGTDAISPYIDRQFSANTFFAHTGDGLFKAVKSAATGIWTKQKVTLAPADLQQEALSFSSYTTRLQVSDENGRGAPEVPVTLTAVGVTGVYIAHEYYIIGPSPIEVKTDTQGSITIVETVKALAATRFTASVLGNDHEVNPMNAPFERNSKLDTVASLQGAVITDKKGNTTPFIPTSTSGEQLEVVAASNEKLATAYSGLVDRPLASLLERPMWMLRPEALAAPSGFVAENIGDNSILTDLGDLFSWLESGIEAVVSIIKDAAEDVWYFVAKIAGEIYHGILDCVETVVAAVTWIYNQIKVAIEDIIKFLEFLFAWSDILITHRVMKNVFIQWVGEAVDNLDAAKAKIKTIFKSLEEDVDTWAELPGFDQTGNATSKENPPHPVQNSAPANLGVHHFEGNVSNASGGDSPPEPGEEIFNDLVDLLKDEEGVLLEAIEAIRADVIEQFDSLTITQIVKRLAAIVIDALLGTVEAVVDAVLDLLIALAEGIVDLLTATIDIPVISDLYKWISGEDLSILDALCLIAAIPATLIYKAVGDAAPFPKGDPFTEGLLGARSFGDVRAQFYTDQALMAATAAEPEPVLNKTRLRLFGVVAGSFALVGSIALGIVSTIQKVWEATDKELGYPKVLASIGAVSNVAYVSPNLAQIINARTDKWYEDMDAVITDISIVKAFIAIPFANTKSLAAKRTFPALESILNLIWNVPVIMNIVEHHDDPETNQTVLITESVGNFAFNVGGMMEFPIYAVEDPKPKLIMTGIQDVLMVGYGALMLTTGIIADNE